jgi:hypothetical protein
MQCVAGRVSIALGKENPVTVALGAERNSPTGAIARLVNSAANPEFPSTPNTVNAAFSFFALPTTFTPHVSA